MNFIRGCLYSQLWQRRDSHERHHEADLPVAADCKWRMRWVFVAFDMRPAEGFKVPDWTDANHGTIRCELEVPPVHGYGCWYIPFQFVPSVNRAVILVLPPGGRFSFTTESPCSFSPPGGRRMPGSASTLLLFAEALPTGGNAFYNAAHLIVAFKNDAVVRQWTHP